jgi:hypothetical protein
VAADIVAHLAHPHRLAAERRLVVQQGVAVVVDDHLQRDAELLAIAQHGLVVVRQARRTDIEIEIVAARPFHGLDGVDLFDALASPDRPIAPAGARSRLQDHALVTGLRELIGGRHSGDAGAQNDHAGPAPRAARQRRRARMRRRNRQQAHRRHCVVGGGDTAGLADEVDESPPRERGTQAAIRHAYDPCAAASVWLVPRGEDSAGPEAGKCRVGAVDLRDCRASVPRAGTSAGRPPHRAPASRNADAVRSSVRSSRACR